MAGCTANQSVITQPLNRSFSELTMAAVSRLLSVGLRRQVQQAVKHQVPVVQFIRRETTDSSTALETRPTVRKFDPEVRQNLTEFGQYVAECMPKYVQKVCLTFSSRRV